MTVMFTRRTSLAWFSVSFVLLFAVPLGVALNNRADLDLPITALVTGLLILAAMAVLGGTALGRRLEENRQQILASALLSIACVVAFQANVVHPLTYFGTFDGEIVLFRRYGAWFWAEWIGFLAAFPLLFTVFLRWPAARPWGAWLPVISCSLMLAQSAWQSAGSVQGDTEIDGSVFEFSSQANLVHLVPDGLQTDTVVRVLRERPDLVRAFEGFTLFEDHLGPYHGTAPALPALLTGEPFDFSRGHIFDWIEPHIDKNAYQNRLAEQGWTIDMVPIHGVYCSELARSCVARPFNDWKSRGYRHYRGGGLAHSLAVLADISLYRMSPSWLKEKIHDEGSWMLAGMTADGSSPWPDPVLREWMEHQVITDGPPSYRFYHYIGAHRPPFWNASCERGDQPGWRSEAFEAQTLCLLRSLAEFLESLKAQGIYDQTAVLVTGDHGHATPPDTLTNDEALPDIEPALLGTARPALLVKPMQARGPLEFDSRPTSLLDVAGVAVALAQGQADPVGLALATREPDRAFYHYSIEDMRRWAAEPIAHDRYRIDGPVTDGMSWQLDGMVSDEEAPGAYPDMNYRTARGFVRGAGIREGDEEQKAAWIRGKQLGFLLFMPAGAAEVTVRLHLPEWIPEQRVRARVNGEWLAGEHRLAGGGDYWSELRLELPEPSGEGSNQFFLLQFDQLFEEPGAPHRRAAAMIGSIGLSTAAE